MTILEFITRTEEHKIVPVFYHSDLETCIEVVNASYQAGVRTFEFVNRGENAADIFKTLIEQIERWPDLEIGIGTIYNKESAQLFIDLGASFVVSPCMVERVASYCNEKNVAYIPGIGTIKEAYDATQMGCQMIKIFPANVIGSAFAKALSSVLSEIAIMPTGGIEPSTQGLKEWFASGVNCVGMGSQLFDKSKILNKDYSGLSNDISKAIQNANLLKN